MEPNQYHQIEKIIVQSREEKQKFQNQIEKMILQNNEEKQKFQILCEEKQKFQILNEELSQGLKAQKQINIELDQQNSQLKSDIIKLKHDSKQDKVQNIQLKKDVMALEDQNKELQQLLSMYTSNQLTNKKTMSSNKTLKKSDLNQFSQKKSHSVQKDFLNTKLDFNYIKSGEIPKLQIDLTQRNTQETFSLSQSINEQNNKSDNSSSDICVKSNDEKLDQSLEIDNEEEDFQFNISKSRKRTIYQEDENNIPQNDFKFTSKQRKSTNPKQITFNEQLKIDQQINKRNKRYSEQQNINKLQKKPENEPKLISPDDKLTSSKYMSSNFTLSMDNEKMNVYNISNTKQTPPSQYQTSQDISKNESNGSMSENLGQSFYISDNEEGKFQENIQRISEYNESINRKRLGQNINLL